MAEYRVYLLDLDDHITVGKDLECDTTEQAHALARGFLLEAPSVEIWRGKDFVAKLSQEPGGAPRMSLSDMPSYQLLKRARTLREMAREAADERSRKAILQVALQYEAEAFARAKQLEGELSENAAD